MIECVELLLHECRGQEHLYYDLLAEKQVQLVYDDWDGGEVYSALRLNCEEQAKEHYYVQSSVVQLFRDYFEKELIQVGVKKRSAPILSARLAGECLDAAYKEHWPSMFRDFWGYGDMEISEGMLIPAKWLAYDLLREQREIGFRRVRIEDYLDRLFYVRLAPALPFELTLSQRFEGCLREVTRIDRAVVSVVCTPDVDFEQLHTQYAFESDDDGFWGVRPLDSFFSSDDLVDGVTEAIKRGSNIVVCPELCCDESGWRLIRERLQLIADWRIVVAGSAHVDMPGTNQRENRLMVFLAREDYANGSPRIDSIQHSKFGDFRFKRPGDREPLREAISRKRKLTAYVVDGILVAFLVCKDILEHSILDAIRALGIRVLAVSAMSPKIEEFLCHSEHLAVTANTFSVVAVSSSEGAASAIVGMPSRHRTVRDQSPDDGSRVTLFD